MVGFVCTTFVKTFVKISAHFLYFYLIINPTNQKNPDNRSPSEQAIVEDVRTKIMLNKEYVFVARV